MRDSIPELRAAIKAQRALIAKVEAEGMSTESLAPYREALALSVMTLIAL